MQNIPVEVEVVSGQTIIFTRSQEDLEITIRPVVGKYRTYRVQIVAKPTNEVVYESLMKERRN